MSSQSFSWIVCSRHIILLSFLRIRQNLKGFLDLLELFLGLLFLLRGIVVLVRMVFHCQCFVILLNLCVSGFFVNSQYLIIVIVLSCLYLLLQLSNLILQVKVCVKSLCRLVRVQRIVQVAKLFFKLGLSEPTLVILWVHFD